MLNFFDPLHNVTQKFNQNHDDQGRFSSSADFNAASIARTQASTATGAGQDKTVAALKARGYAEDMKSKATGGVRFFTKEIGDEFADNSHGHISHTVMVNRDGSWTHSVEGMHSGQEAESLAHITGDLPNVVAHQETPAGPDKIKAPDAPFKEAPYSFRVDDVMKPYVPEAHPTDSPPPRRVQSSFSTFLPGASGTADVNIPAPKSFTAPLPGASGTAEVRLEKPSSPSYTPPAYHPTHGSIPSLQDLLTGGYSR